MTHDILQELEESERLGSAWEAALKDPQAGVSDWVAYCDYHSPDRIARWREAFAQMKADLQQSYHVQMEYQQQFSDQKQQIERQVEERRLLRKGAGLAITALERSREMVACAGFIGTAPCLADIDIALDALRASQQESK